MSVQHEEFEAGHEMDRAFRAAVTGLSQLMERVARRHQESARENAAREREEWLARRDAARASYLPWMGEGRLESLDPEVASRKWATAAAWSQMDPTAQMAEREMGQRIRAQHGQRPSILLQRTDLTTVPPDPDPAVKLLTMNEAIEVAEKQAPPWYTIPEGISRLEEDRPPVTEPETAFHDQWQHWSETGELPPRERHEQWAAHVGRAEEFAPGQWVVNSEGEVDWEARDAALEDLWDAGRDQRVSEEIADHEARLREHQMNPLADHLGVPGRDRAWEAFQTPESVAAAQPDALARAWRDASAAALTGDQAAQQAATRLGQMVRDQHGVSPESLLIASLAEQASHETEARRAAEDQARTAREASRNPDAAANRADPSRTSETVTRERIVEINETAAAYYAGNLPDSPGHQYFTDRLGPEVTNGPWELGYARPGWQNLTSHLRDQGVNDQEMVAAGLAENGQFGVRDVFRDRAMMGIRDHNTGELVGFVGRDLSEDPRAPKVRNTGQTPAFTKGDQVFGLREASPGARLVRTEGPFDAIAITLASEGKAAGVAPLGTQMTSRQADAIAERANGRVWIANDTDPAGTVATEEDWRQFTARGAEVRQIEVPGSDPAEAWQHRPEAMRASLENLHQAPSAAETVLARYLDSPEATASGTRELMRELRPHLTDPDRVMLDQRAADLAAARGFRYDAHDAETRAGEDLRQDRRAADDHRQATGSDDQDLTDVDGEEHDHQEHQAQLDDQVANSERHYDHAHETTDQAETREARAYDRRNEAVSDLNVHQEKARDGASHGFSKPTRDQVAPPQQRTRGRAAKTQRATGMAPDAARRLKR